MSEIITRDWKAWINKQPVQPTPGGTLYITGEVDTQGTDEARLIKKIPQGINPAILLLEIKAGGIVPAKNPQKVHYTEGLQKLIYTSVEIFHNEEVIARITDIPETH